VAPFTRRSLLRGSLGLVASAALPQPHIANAAAKTAAVWWTKGFVPEEDRAFRAAAADYEKASGNKIDPLLIPFAELRQKEISAVATGIVPDLMEASLEYAPTFAWRGQLVDVTDVVETQKANYIPSALASGYFYDNVAKTHKHYGVPEKAEVVPFHFWQSLVEKAGYKMSQIPNTWDAFLDFFKPVQAKLRAQGMRNVYAYGYQLSANGVDPNATFEAFMIAYGGKDFVTSDGRLHASDPQVREAALKALVKLTAAYKGGFVPPGVTDWNDADDNNAFHAKRVVMDFDGTISTELALHHDKEAYDDIVTRGLPLSDEGEELPSQLISILGVVPKGAKNIAVAKEFLTYLIEPKVLNAYLKAGLGRYFPPMLVLAKSDPFWLDPADPHRSAYVYQGLFGPTIPQYQVYNPAMSQVEVEHLFSRAVLDVIKGGMSPQTAIDKALNRAEAIFAKYPIAAA
jgi:multiple sugar transport system substrate-binding protein